MDIIFTN